MPTWPLSTDAESRLAGEGTRSVERRDRDHEPETGVRRDARHAEGAES